ncbi:MAG: hypothetical protein ACPG7E_08365 [Marinirhabdus sp.]
MEHIAEPKGVDFLIESEPLKHKERKELTEFIKKRKKQIVQKNALKQKSRKKEKSIPCSTKGI